MGDRRLVVIDPSYVSRTGHNHAANSLLAEEAARNRIPVLLFANVGLLGDNVAVRAFRVTAYNFFPAAHLDALRVSYLIAQTFFEDLAKIVQPELLPGDVLLLHTANNPLLHGFASWLQTVSQVQRLGVCVGLILPPDFRQSDPGIVAFNRHHYCCIFDLLTRLPIPIRYYAETSRMEELFKTLGAKPMYRNRLPLGIHPGIPAYPVERAGAPLIFFVPGEIRAEKGHAFLINGLVSIVQTTPDLLDGVRFRFTATAMPPDLAAFLKRFPSLFEVIPDSEISNLRYWELMRDADFVVCTYDPKDYGYRSSSIFYEALASGIPVLVSSNTSMAHDLSEDDAQAGLLVEYGNVESLARATQDARAGTAEFRRRARSIAPKYQAALSAPEYLGWLMNAAGRINDPAPDAGGR